MKLFDLEVLTPEKKMYSGKAESVFAMAEQGSLTILADHAPLVSSLTFGPVKIKDETGKVSSFRLKSGLLKVLNNRVSVLIRDA